MEKSKYRIQTITTKNGNITYSPQIKTEEDKWEALLHSGEIPTNSLNYLYWATIYKDIAIKAIENHKEGGVEIKHIETEYL